MFLNLKLWEHTIDRECNTQDDTMALLKHTITIGWPCIVQELLKELKYYWMLREDMTVEDGLIHNKRNHNSGGF